MFIYRMSVETMTANDLVITGQCVDTVTANLLSLKDKVSGQ